MAWAPKVVKTVVDGDIHSLAVGHSLVDEYLAFLGARVRLNSWLAAAYDLKVFFSVIAKDPGTRTRCGPWTSTSTRPPITGG